MNKWKVLLSVLLALALIGACGSVLAESDGGSAEIRDYFSDDQMTLVDEGGYKLRFDGTMVISDTLTYLGVIFENHSDRAVAAEYGIGRDEADVTYSALCDCVEPGQSFDKGAIQFEFEEFQTLGVTGISLRVRDFETQEIVMETPPVLVRFFDTYDQGAPESASYEALQVGSKGDAVKALQEKLIELGYLDGEADGIYGNGTAAAVRKFQADEGLPETGAAAPSLQEALFSK